ncbi:MAG: sulfate transporter CysZ [Pseudomonadales bacterium]|nr:sulfate transporter CysZ [Pseudomonadales bacterium]MDP6471892.1 sulfate transporter CysZ [Pseudomonadales bacterium]MDP6826838.1 sulfate transporter CysZ [Pseudomonadales bacterium]MDP6970884.1 sulfate transporter CysZ [Pseudomonadales bacterium]
MSVATGIGAFGDGYRILRQRGIWRFILVPALISFFVVAMGLWFAITTIDALSERALAVLPEWLSFLDWLLTPLIYLFVFLVGGWLFGLLAAAFSGPFMGKLSRVVERRAGLPEAPPEPPLLASIAAAVKREARKMLYHLPRLLAAFLLTLIPVVNAVSPLIWFFFGAWVMAVQFADLPAENWARPFKDTCSRLREHRLSAIAFGGCTTALMSVPIVNILVIPVAVAGGTLLWHRLESDVQSSGGTPRKDY